MKQQDGFRHHLHRPRIQYPPELLPDFLAQKKDGSYVIIEVKGENMIDNAVVQAKARSAAELAAANAMTYEMIPSLKATYGLQQLHEAFL